MICVFDIESIPDVDLLREIYGYEGDDFEVCKQAFAYQKEISGSEFLPLPFHKIISIASLAADDFGNFIKVGHFAKDILLEEREEILLKEFNAFMNRKNPKLVSFNGRGFDVPLIGLKSLKYNIDMSWYYENENQDIGKNKWDNYMKRYSDRFHIDLFDVLGNYGATRYLNLDVLCKMSGILGKYDVSGNQVYEIIFKENDIKKVDSYCESDVLNTYWLYLKFEITRGFINLDDYKSNLKKMKEAIASKDAHYKEAFMQSIESELESI